MTFFSPDLPLEVRPYDRRFRPPDPGRAAFVRYFRVFFLTNGTSAVNEDLHPASSKDPAVGFACLVRTQNVIFDIETQAG
ncbi:MAG: hypothetical protein SV487_08220 [Thermodesulfobacteriota bacterium]|nr:hypothetical protein [Thermodesulfobacteriota bacterium]